MWQIKYVYVIGMAHMIDRWMDGWVLPRSWHHQSVSALRSGHESLSEAEPWSPQFEGKAVRQSYYVSINVYFLRNSYAYTVLPSWQSQTSGWGQTWWIQSERWVLWLYLCPWREPRGDPLTSPCHSVKQRYFDTLNFPWVAGFSCYVNDFVEVTCMKYSSSRQSTQGSATSVGLTSLEMSQHLIKTIFS